ncbi:MULTISPECIES: DegV family protein [unclassified Clostridium]|uniref:DegV family protein n=1 Tax=unclassified Clostridium TaxID=2614128 RepID=UPI0002975CA8|nr:MULTISPECIES: DegV family protein [unclassified Clostridium]EKQ57016.1 MAG: EDD domain protein, DegV family [Clostridium sp. Maddingley MBC34-26]
MRDFKIITDSGCDLSYEIINSLDIEYLGLECEIEGTRIIEDGGKILNYKNFYEKLIKGAMPKTSQITPNRFIQIFEKYISLKYDILYIALSSGLSGTFNSALTAREEILEKYPEANIKIIDSKAASSGQGLLVYTAAKLKEESKSLNEIVDYIEEYKRNLYHFFTVKDLKHLERGGRINSASAIVGSVLNITPILTVNEEGTLEVIKKIRGEKKVLKELIKYIGQNICENNLNTVFISHADNNESVEFLLCLIKEKFKVKDVIISYMGLAVGSHTGQGAVGVYFLGKRRK